MQFELTNVDFVTVLAYYEQLGTWKKLLYGRSDAKVFFLEKKGNQINFNSFSGYDHFSCDYKIATFYVFSLSEMIFIFQGFFDPQPTNLNGCEVRFIFGNYTPYDKLEKEPDGNLVASGVNIEILEQLAIRMNFTPSFGKLTPGKNNRNYFIINNILINNKLNPVFSKAILIYSRRCRFWFHLASFTLRRRNFCCHSILGRGCASLQYSSALSS